MREVIGKCPKCGSMFLAGKYGPFCSSDPRCGFRIGKIFGEELSKDEAKSLMSGDEVPLQRISRKTDKEYEVLVKFTGIKEYPYTRKDGTDAVGFYPEISFRFPEKSSDTRETKDIKEKTERSEKPGDIVKLSVISSDDLPAASGGEEMPF